MFVFFKAIYKFCTTKRLFAKTINIKIFDWETLEDISHKFEDKCYIELLLRSSVYQSSSCCILNLALLRRGPGSTWAGGSAEAKLYKSPCVNFSLSFDRDGRKDGQQS